MTVSIYTQINGWLSFESSDLNNLDAHAEGVTDISPACCIIYLYVQLIIIYLLAKLSDVEALSVNSYNETKPLFCRTGLSPIGSPDSG